MSRYDTNQLTEKHRVFKLDGEYFNECDYCGANYKEIEGKGISIRYWHQFGIVMCDRCLDKANYGNELWQEGSSERNNLPPYPIKDKPKRILENCFEIREYRSKKYGYIEDKETFIRDIKGYNGNL